jgi:UDP:flavonoid glycosyltransferase YjiC (YdhE family)
LAAGVPSVIVPLVADQFWWAKALQKSGLGPKFLPRRSLTKDKLARGITEALQEKYQERAGEVGRKMNEEDGVGLAVRMIEDTFKDIS